MDYKSINFDWNRARAFLVTAEEGSFSAAAKALKLTQSTLGRQVNALEEELGVVLFERVGKGIQITPAGLELIENVREMANAAIKLSLSASGRSEELEGVVTISASEVNSAYILPAILKKIRSKAPRIQIEIISKNDGSDLRTREADIAIRNFVSDHPDLIMKKVKDSVGHLYASPSYIKKFGPFKSKKDLSKADFVTLGDTALFMKALDGMGIETTMANFPYITESHFTHWSLVKEGIAMGIISEVIGDNDKSVERVLKNFQGFPFSTWIVS
ncbi:MAG: LysR family transcriptional regulator, partial [Halobacteriovoraceae bacterium]|nr:LysR family transcriptional regulator [Halobacteriovoraceae bacterium]